MKKIIGAMVSLVIILLIVVIVFLNNNKKVDYNTLDDMKGKTIGVQTGTIYDELVKSKIKNAKLKYYENYNDMVSALLNKEIDGYAYDEPSIKYVMKNYNEIDYIPTALNEQKTGYALNKDKRGNEILSKLNEYLNKANKDGTLDKLKHIWFGDDNSKKVIEDINLLSSKNDKIILGVEEYNEPFCYYDSNNKITGYEIALMADFCKKYGYGLEIKTYSFEKLMDQNEKIDVRASSISITEERKELFNFSEPTYLSNGVIAIIKDKELKLDNIVNVSDLAYGKIGVLPGTIFEEVANSYIEKAEYKYYENNEDMFSDLAKGNIDGVIIDDSIAKFYSNKYNNLKILDKLLTSDSYAFTFKDEKNNALEREFSDYIQTIRRNGKINEIEDIWINNFDENKKIDIDFKSLKNINGEIKVLVPEVFMEPFVFEIDGKKAGYDYEILYNFCKEKGYSCNIETSSFYEIFDKVANGSFDLAMGDITVTADRAKIIKYSKETYIGGVVAVIRDLSKPIYNE